MKNEPYYIAYAFIGNKKILKKFREILYDIVYCQDSLENEKAIAYYFGLESFSGAGDIISISLMADKEEYSYFFVEARDLTKPNRDLFDTILQKQYAGLISYEIAFVGTQTGDSLDTNTDFFPIVYKISILPEEGKEISGKFSKLEEAESFISRYTKEAVSFDDLSSCQKYLETKFKTAGICKCIDTVGPLYLWPLD